jgi:hypothetical protein
MNRFAIKNGLLQSDLDFAGFKRLNDTTPGGGGSSLPAGTYNVKDNGLVGDGVTDDTAALQTLINLVVTNGGGTIYFPDAGPYILGGPLQDPTYRNAQILFPTLPIPGPKVPLVFKGFVNPTYWPNVFQTSDNMPSGTTIKSTLSAGSGTGPSVFNGRGNPSSAYDEATAIFATFEDITLQTVANPSYSGLNLMHLPYICLKDVNVIAGSNTAELGIIEPTVATSYGIILPSRFKSIMSDLSGNIVVQGFYNGYRWGEFANAKQVVADCCKIGIEFGFSEHSSLINRYEVIHCVRGASVTGTHPLQILQWDSEEMDTAGKWNNPVYEIDDPSNYGRGDVTWRNYGYSTGELHTFSKNGGTGIQTREIGSIVGGSTVMIGTKARLVAIAGPPGGVQLQVLNNSAVWENVDSWTAST